MSAKTKIVVLHMKELIYTAVFAAMGILFIILMVIMFWPKDDSDDISVQPDAAASAKTISLHSSATSTTKSSTSGKSKVNYPVQTSASTGMYIPGIYTTELVLGGQSVDVEVIVNQEAISSIRLANPSESVITMYPLLEPTLDSISDQIYATQSLADVTYTADSKYTSLILLEAIRNSLNKARIS